MFFRRVNLCSVIGGKEPEMLYFHENMKKIFFSFWFSWNFSGKSHCVITATDKWLKQYEKNKAGEEGRKRRWLIMHVKTLFTHTRTISSFEKRMQKIAHTHFLHFSMHNGPLSKSTNLVIFLHRGFVMLVKKAAFWMTLCFFFFMLSAHEMKLTERDYFPVVIQHSAWCKAGFEGGKFALFSARHPQPRHKIG